MRATLLDKWRLLETITNDPALSHADDAVAMVLLNHVDAQKGYSWISRPSIAALTGLSERNVMRSLDRLESQGYFEATASRGRGNSQTFKPNYERVRHEKKATAPSPFRHNKKATAPSEKGDSAVTKKETARVEKRRQGCLPNPFRESVYDSAGESLVPDTRAREAFEAEVEEEADFRAAFLQRERDYKARKAATNAAMQAPSTSALANTDSAAEPTKGGAPPQSPSPRRAAAAPAFSVNEHLRPHANGRLHIERYEFASLEEAQAKRALILRDKRESETFWVDIRDCNGELINTRQVAEDG